jgi:hypothetical protein
MGRRVVDGRRPLGRLIVATGVMVALAASWVPGGAAAAATDCHVVVADSGRAVRGLQAAVRAAKPGDLLTVEGTCRGGTFIDRSITIRGITTRRMGKAVLDGGGDASQGARVLTIKPGVKVHISDLVIRNGNARRVPDGGGISNRGRLTLSDVVIRDNAAVRGGGVFNEGVLRMLGRNVVKDNAGRLPSTPPFPPVASGVYNAGLLVLGGETRIRSNDGGAAVINAGTLRMTGASSIRANVSFRSRAGVTNLGLMSMEDSSSISRQGPVSNQGTLTMNDSSAVHGNTSASCCGPGAPGGGVANEGTLTMNDSSAVHHNLVMGPQTGHPPDQPGARGGGVHNTGSLTMTGSSRIFGNEARLGGSAVPGLGGGVYSASGGTLAGVSCGPGVGANVSDNTPDDCHVESP